MIKSMTGFGRAENSNDTLKFVVEIKSVNHRYLDTNVRIPKEYAFLDTYVRSEVKRKLGRGKVDVFVSYELLGDADYELQVNEKLAREYVDAYARVEKLLGLKNDLTVGRLSNVPEIFKLVQESLDEEEIWKLLRKAVDDALDQLIEARTREGGNLKKDLIEKLGTMDTLVTSVEERYPQILKEYEAKLKEKVSEVLGDAKIDESRIAAEIVIFADKLATDEETVRLKSHIGSMKKELEGGGDVGRKLDFIAQEMNREANTILSKANDLETSNYAIELKTMIERIREQVQNVE